MSSSVVFQEISFETGTLSYHLVFCLFNFSSVVLLWMLIWRLVTSHGPNSQFTHKASALQNICAVHNAALSIQSFQSEHSRSPLWNVCDTSHHWLLAADSLWVYFTQVYSLKRFYTQSKWHASSSKPSEKTMRSSKNTKTCLIFRSPIHFSINLWNGLGVLVRPCSLQLNSQKPGVSKKQFWACPLHSFDSILISGRDSDSLMTPAVSSS